MAKVLYFFFSNLIKSYEKRLKNKRVCCDAREACKMGGFSMLLAHSNSVFSYVALNRVSSVMQLRKLFTLSCITKVKNHKREEFLMLRNDWSGGV